MLKLTLFGTGVVLMVAGVLVRRHAAAQRGEALLAREREYQLWVASKAVRNGQIVTEMVDVSRA